MMRPGATMLQIPDFLFHTFEALLIVQTHERAIVN